MLGVSSIVRKHRGTPLDISLYIPPRSQEPELWNLAHIRAAGGWGGGIFCHLLALVMPFLSLVSHAGRGCDTSFPGK